tara:strand:+ start:67 stop:480 length:414 start_codon:yes stop_codon:yes gene_type:complete
MASVLKVDTVTGVTTAGSIAVTGEGNSTTTNLQQGLGKAWINFQQKSSNVVRDSFNHSSFTDGGTGTMTFTITSLMNNINYCHSGMAGEGGNSQECLSQAYTQTVPTTAAAQYVNAYVNTGLEDPSYAGRVLHGDLA